jgi:hypothetical protein
MTGADGLKKPRWQIPVHWFLVKPAGENILAKACPIYFPQAK